MLNPGAQAGQGRRKGTGKRLTREERAKLKKQREREIRRKKRDDKRQESQGTRNATTAQTDQRKPT